MLGRKTAGITIIETNLRFNSSDIDFCRNSSKL